MARNRCPICNEIIDKGTRICPACRQIFRTTFFSRYYRPIVFFLVMLNTALIVFLVGFIWLYGLEDSATRNYNGSETNKSAAEQMIRESSEP